MGRPAKFGEERILDAALEVVAAQGPAAATISAIAARLGAPVGSIYHRFPSRDLLLARLWIRGVRRFQDGFLEAIAADDLEAAALHTPRWCRGNLAGATVLLLHRHQDLAARWPDELSGELDGLNRIAAQALEACAERRDAPLERILFALVDVPYGAVRRHLLAGRPPPVPVDGLVVRTVRAVLAPGPAM